MTLRDFFEQAKVRFKNIFDERELQNVLSLIVEETWGFSKKQQRLMRDDLLTTDQLFEMEKILERIDKDEPVQYILGTVDFYGLRLHVNHLVLIPRPETEELVDLAIQKITSGKIKNAKILDIGTGSGCIAISLKKNIPDAEIYALDVSDDALKVAKENAAANNVEINFLHHDFLDEKKWNELKVFDVILSNPPYVTKTEFHELMPRVKNFEPKRALLAEDNDPFIFYKKIAVFGKNHLNKNGMAFLEINNAHAEEIKSFFINFSTQIIKDLQGNDRIIFLKKSF